MRRFALILVVLFSLVASANEKIQTRVNLTTEPAGATVFIDDEKRGLTPLMLFDLKPGAHHVKYCLAGYQTRDTFIDVSPVIYLDQNEVLEEEKGLLLIRTNPEGCHIKINGLSVGESPRFISNLSAKDVHKVVLSKPGYQSQTISVKFNGREPLVRDEKLILDSGTLELVTDPSGAEVMVNGIVRGTTPLTVRDIPKGTAIVKFKLEGYQDETREVRMNAGEEQTMSVSLSGVPGTLHLISIPADASFYVNDEARGRGPLSIPGLKPGEYSVRCEKEGFGTLSRIVTIGNGASAREEFKLQSVMGRIEIRTTPAGAEVFLDGKLKGRTRGANPDEQSDVLAIENVLEGDHALVVRKDGFKEASGDVHVESRETFRRSVSLKRAFVPNVEVTTTTEVIRGVFKSQDSQSIVIERKPGLDYPIPRQFVRKIQYLDK